MALTPEQIKDIRTRAGLSPDVPKTTQTAESRISSLRERSAQIKEERDTQRITDDRGILEKITTSRPAEIIQDIFPGKRVGETLGTVGGLGLTAAREKLGFEPKGATKEFDISAPSPAQVAGDIAKGAATIVGFKAKAAAGIIPKALQFGGLGAVSAGGEAAAEGDDFFSVLKRAAKGGAIGVATGVALGTLEKGFKSLGNFLGKRGEQIQTRVIKPSARDVKDGFNIKNVSKYKLGGSLKQTFEKSDAALDDLGKQLNLKLYGTENFDEALKLGRAKQNVRQQINSLKTVLKETPTDDLVRLGGEKEVINRALVNIKDALVRDKVSLPAIKALKPGAFSTLDDLATKIDDLIPGLPEIPMQGVYDDTARAMLSTKGKVTGFGSNKSINRALQNLQDEIAETTGQSLKQSILPIPEAQMVKRQAGHLGAWKFGADDPEARAAEKVYTQFYRALKKRIEDISPEGVRGINKQMSDIIPVTNAVIRRIPIADRNAALSLSDLVTLSAATIDPRALGLTMANFLGKSGKFGGMLAEKAPALGRAAGGLVQKAVPAIRGAQQLNIGASNRQTDDQ